VNRSSAAPAHGGNIYRFAHTLGCQPDEIIDFSANINPEQAVDPAELLPIDFRPYPDPSYTDLKQALGLRYPYPGGIAIEVFNGASAAIFALLKYLQPAHLVLYAPLYVEYAAIARQLSSRVYEVNRFKTCDFRPPAGSTIVFVNPATPDGHVYELTALLQRWQEAGCTVIIDESFLDFTDAPSVAEHIPSFGSLFIIKSLSKFYGCAGVRIGFLAGPSSAVGCLQRLEPAWKLSAFDMAYMQKALTNIDFIERTRQQTSYRRQLLYSLLSGSGLFATVYAGRANFLLARLAEGDGFELQQQLAEARILVRICANFTGLDSRYLRFAVKDEAALDRLRHALARCAR
jgi:threonine-phosphate decarboxylase